MIAQVHSATLSGIDALPVVVEVDLQHGTPDFHLVGLPDAAVKESYHRVQTAIRNSGLTFPITKIICNLAPGDLKKEGPSLDLPIALAILAAQGTVPLSELQDILISGELGLDGMIRPVNGAVSIALLAQAEGKKRLLLPKPNASEAAVIPGLEVYGMASLLDAVEMLNGSMFAQPIRHESAAKPLPSYSVDFSDIKGQKHAIRALEIAAAGGHNLLMTGPPGSGKTMLARRVPTILPALSLNESIEVTRIYSSSGNKGGSEGLIWERPFRSPHHTASYAAIVGGGANPKPGEISLAHHGVLFMDEMPEFNGAVLEALRQPLEDGVVTVARVAQSLTFPARAMLIGAMNPCPCGFRGYPEAKCVGAHACDRYGTKISGPLLDRIDLHIIVPRLKPDELANQPIGESSDSIRERVIAARKLQAERFGRPTVNGCMSPREIRDLIPLDQDSAAFMQLVASKLNLSARVFDRLLKVARTIADLDQSELVSKSHLSEAVQYRGSTS